MKRSTERLSWGSVEVLLESSRRAETGKKFVGNFLARKLGGIWIFNRINGFGERMELVLVIFSEELFLLVRVAWELRKSGNEWRDEMLTLKRQSTGPS